MRDNHCSHPILTLLVFLQSYAQMGLKFGIRLYISTICLPKVILDACSDLSSLLWLVTTTFLLSDWSSISWNKSLFELSKKISYGFSRLEEVGHSSQNQKCQQSVVKMLRQLCGQWGSFSFVNQSELIIFEFSHDSGASETSITSSVANERLHQNLETLPKNTIGKKIDILAFLG